MKNKQEGQEADKYGQITFFEESKLLVDIIGQNAILGLMSEKNPKSYKSNKRKLERMNKGEMPDNGFASLRCYCEEFFKKIESEYEVSLPIMTSHNLTPKSFIWDFSLYAESNKILGKSKKEIALFLLHGRAFNCIFKTSEKKVIEFLRDSYKIVFDEIMQIFKNKETFYKEINNYCDNNREKYPKLSEREVADYKQNIINWRDESVYNPNWRTLVPVLDYLYQQKHISFVHRLIGLYLRKNAQKALLDILDVSEDELQEIIGKIADMIEDKNRPEKIPYDHYFDDIWLDDLRKKIYECLEFQNNYENSTDVEKSNSIIEHLKRNYFHFPEGKFLYFWLQTRAKVFEKHNDLKGHIEELQEEILKDYRKALDELRNGTKSHFLIPFLLEIMLINDFFYPRRVKDITDYYEYGRVLGANEWNEWDENRYKEFRNPDIRKALVNIYNYFLEIQRPFWEIISQALNMNNI